LGSSEGMSARVFAPERWNPGWAEGYLLMVPVTGLLALA